MSTFAERIRQRLQVAVLASLITLVYVSMPDSLYEGIEHYLYDALISWQPPIDEEGRVVIVDIDEPSLARYGAWPWPRKRVAELVQTLTERHKVGLLGVDIVFPEKKPDDDALQAALDQPSVIMSQVIDFSPASTNRVGTLGDTFTPVSPSPFPRASGYVGNHPGVLPAHPRVGHISPVLDNDGRVRRVYPVACLEAACTQALSLRMFTQLMENSHQDVSLVAEQGASVLRISFPHQPPLDLPLDQQQAVMVPYHVGVNGFQSLSAAQVLEPGHRFPQLENSIVLLGSTALGIGDRIATPLGKLTPGIALHAQMLIALLDRSLIRPLTATSKPFLLLAAGVIVSFLLWPHHRRTLGLVWVWSVLLLIGTGVLLSWLLLAHGLWLPLSPVAILIVLLSIMHTAQQNLKLNRRMRTLGAQFSQFLPSTLVGRLLQNRPIGPESALHTMTVLIVDVRDFTASSEGKSPEQIAEFAQHCLEVFAAEVARYHGTIEKYTGDGLMALWGVPTEDDTYADKHQQPPATLYVLPAEATSSNPATRSHALYAAQAISAGLAMQRAVDALIPFFEEKGYSALKLSIGINTGPMHVGVFGGQSHLAWSAQGQAFNIASRIEQLTRTTGKNLLMGEATAQLIDPAFLEQVGHFPVKGMSHPILVYGIKSTACEEFAKDLTDRASHGKLRKLLSASHF